MALTAVIVKTPAGDPIDHQATASGCTPRSASGVNRVVSLPEVTYCESVPRNGQIY
jgi:hypothetical protein